MYAATETRPSIVLRADELVHITGYRQPAAQLAELLRRGFTRARRERGNGRVIVERMHYEAVSAASAAQTAPQAQNDDAAPNVTALQDWARRRGQRGQKTQG